jgi:hypothetical protein
MKFQVTHPKIWEAVCSKDMPMKNKIKVYEKMGGAYRLGEDGGEQVFNTMTDLLKYKAGKMDEEVETSNDYEVSMSQKQLDGIIKAATELKQKMGEQEFNVAAWVQDHISQALNFITQANTGFNKDEE